MRRLTLTPDTLVGSDASSVVFAILPLTFDCFRPGVTNTKRVTDLG